MASIVVVVNMVSECRCLEIGLVLTWCMCLGLPTFENISFIDMTIDETTVHVLKPKHDLSAVVVAELIPIRLTRILVCPVVVRLVVPVILLLEVVGLSVVVVFVSEIYCEVLVDESVVVTALELHAMLSPGRVLFVWVVVMRLLLNFLGTKNM